MGTYQKSTPKATVYEGIPPSFGFIWGIAWAICSRGYVGHWGLCLVSTSPLGGAVSLLLRSAFWLGCDSEGAKELGALVVNCQPCGIFQIFQGTWFNKVFFLKLRSHGKNHQIQRFSSASPHWNMVWLDLGVLFFWVQRLTDLIDQTLELASFGLDFWTTWTTVFWSTSFAEDFGTAGTDGRRFYIHYLSEFLLRGMVFFFVVLLFPPTQDGQTKTPSKTWANIKQPFFLSTRLDPQIVCFLFFPAALFIGI